MSTIGPYHNYDNKCQKRIFFKCKQFHGSLNVIRINKNNKPCIYYFTFTQLPINNTENFIPSSSTKLNKSLVIKLLNYSVKNSAFWQSNITFYFNWNAIVNGKYSFKKRKQELTNNNYTSCKKSFFSKFLTFFPRWNFSLSNYKYS